MELKWAVIDGELRVRDTKNRMIFIHPYYYSAGYMSHHEFLRDPKYSLGDSPHCLIVPPEIFTNAFRAIRIYNKHNIRSIGYEMPMQLYNRVISSKNRLIQIISKVFDEDIEKQLGERRIKRKL